MTTTISPHDFVTALTPALRQASAIARALEGRVRNRPKTGESRAAKAALTIADTASQEALLVPLYEHFPTVCVEAEEDTPTAALFPREGVTRVVIDPIDGTLHSYLDARGPYAVMLGLAEGESYVAALVGLPREGLYFDAVRGSGAHLPPGAETGGRQVLVSHELPAPVRETLEAAGYEPVPASGGAIAVAPLVPGVCAGLRLVAPGTSVSRRGRIGLLIAREAGLEAWDERGERFPDDLDTPRRALLLAREDADLENLRRALAAAPSA